MPNKKTKSHNRRLHNRGGKNVFWLAVNTYKHINEPVLFSRKPTSETISTGTDWHASHSKYYPNRTVLDRLNIDPHDKTIFPLKVRLETTTDPHPDLYIQRLRNHIFIASYTITFFHNAWKTEVPHNSMLSQKLFPEITEESGIKGIKILPID